MDWKNSTIDGNWQINHIKFLRGESTIALDDELYESRNKPVSEHTFLHPPAIYFLPPPFSFECRMRADSFLAQEAQRSTGRRSKRM